MIVVLLLGKVQYKKEKQLGKGAYATVYKCFNLNTKKYVAIKVNLFSTYDNFNYNPMIIQ